MNMQFVGVAVVCKSEHPGFKKAEETTWDSASLSEKTKRDYAKEKLRENMGQSESKERGFKQGFKEDFRSKFLKNCKGVRP
jgi:hypothetical protein